MSTLSAILKRTGELFKIQFSYPLPRLAHCSSDERSADRKGEGVLCDGNIIPRAAPHSESCRRPPHGGQSGLRNHWKTELGCGLGISRQGKRPRRH